MTTQISEEVYTKLVKDRPYLWWWVPETRNLSLESVVEGVLSNGDMEDVQLLFAVAGRDTVRKTFLKQISEKRCNYRPQTVHFFRKVFLDDQRTCSDPRGDTDLTGAFS